MEQLQEERLGLNEEIRQGDLRLQELMDERVWLREKSTMEKEEVKKLEEGIKDFLSRKTVVIEQDELDYINRHGDCYHLRIVMPKFLILA